MGKLKLPSGAISTSRRVDSDGTRRVSITVTPVAGAIKPNGFGSPGSIGNTTGIILPVTDPAVQRAKIKPETPQEKGWWDSWGDAVHMGLDVVGMIPVVGEVADLANAAIYVAEGDYANAALSAASAVPGAGNAVTAAKWGKRGLEAVDTAADATKAVKAAKGTKAAKAADAPKPKAGGGGPKPPKKTGGKSKGKPNKCRMLAATIYAQFPEVASRFIDLMNDKLNLFGLTVKVDGTKGSPHPSLPKGSGTWHGHIQQLEQKQRSMRENIKGYDAAKCKQPKIAKSIRDLAYQPIPKKPGGAPGYPLTSLPK